MRKLLIFIFFIVLIQGISAQIPTTGLLGYYPFNGNANDASGNAQHGTVNGSTLTADRFGNTNSAYSFNGSTNYISLPAGTFTTLNLYTYSCWIKPQGTAGGFALCFGESAFGICQTLAFQPTGSVTAGSYYGSGSQSLIHSSVTYSTNQWIHIAMTRDLTTIKLYVNGVLFTSSSAATFGSNAYYGTNQPIRAYIGARTTGTSYFNGSIDDVRIYNNAVTQTEIIAMYNESCFQNVTNSTYTLCSGNSATISAAPAPSNTINWYSSFTSTSSIASGSVLSTPVLSAGTYTYFAAASSCTLTNQRLPITVSVSPSPIISVNNGTICSGNSFTISPTGATSYSYSNGSVVAPSANTTYTVVGQNSNGCLSNVASLTVNVNTSPSISVNSGFVCNGDSFTLTPSGASSYTYSGGSAIVTPVANTSYTITGSNGNGCYATAVSNVGVVAKPILVVSNPGNICIGNSANLSVSGANFYTWNSGATSASIVVTPSVTTNYTVSGVNLFGCITSSILTVNVNPLPVISVNSGSVCFGNIFTIIPSGAATYTYSSGSNNVSPLVNTSYSVTGTSAQGCVSSNVAVSNVSVLALPSISVNSGSVCAGAAFTINPTGGISYTYSGGSAIVSPVSTTNYTVTGAGSNGCSNTAVSTVSVIGLPSVIISGLSAICNGDNVVLMASGASSYSWNTGAISSSISVSPGSSTTYSVIGFNVSACENTASKLVTVNPLPFISVNSGSICSGSSFTMIPTGASTYTFSNGSNIVSPFTTSNYSVTGTSAQGCLSSNTAVSNVNVVNNPVITVNSGAICIGSSFTMIPSGGVSYVYSSGSSVVSPIATSQYTVTGSNASGCSSSAISNVTVNTLPLVSITGSAAICFGNSTTLGGAGANSYTWNTGATTQSISASPNTTSSYSVSGMDLNGCRNSATVILTVNPLPVISIASGSVCLGNSYTLTPSGASTYTYSSGSNIVSPISNTSYSVTGTSAQGCLSSNVAVANITVVSLPLISVNSGTVCSGTVFTMLPTGAVTYSYSNGSNTVIPTSNSSYTVSGINAQGCISAPAIANASVIALPIVSVNSGSICAGSSFTLTPTGAASFTISGSSSVVSPPVTSTYSITGSNVSGCISSVVVSTVTVHTLPLISVNSGSVCAGQAFSMLPSGAASYVYSNGSSTVIPVVNTSFTVTGISAQGCPSSNQAIASVTVNPLPVISVNSGTICSGDAFSINASGASSYTYSGGNSVVTPSSTTSYSVTGTSSLGCISSVPAVSTVSVLASPAVNIVGNATVCSGSATSYTAFGAISYSWNIGAITPIVNVTVTANTVYTVLGTGANGCISAATKTVTVSSTPSISANNGTICSGSSFVITPTGASSYSFSGGTATVSPTANTIYTVTGSSAGCLASNVLSVSVVVHSLPSITIVGSASVCEGSSTNLTALGASNYTWNTGFVGSSLSITPMLTGSYSVSGEDLNGCSNTATAQVFVNSLPTLSVNSGAICPGNSFTFTPSGALSYTYSSGSNIVTPLLTSTYSVIGSSPEGCISALAAIATVSVVNSLTVSVTGNTIICEGETANLLANGASNYIWSNGILTNTISLSPTATTNYTVTGVSGTCSNDAVFSVSVNPSPTVTVNNGTICLGSSFTINPSGASSYTYSSGSALVSPTVITSYTVLGSDNNGCISSAVSNVVVNSLPIITVISSSPNDVCPGEEVILISSGAVSYLWSSNGATTSSIVISPTVTSVYTVTGIDQNGCEGLASVVQNVIDCTGINELANSKTSDFIIYPNPSNGNFSIHYDLGSVQSCKLTMLDLQGKTIFTHVLTTQEKKYNLTGLDLLPGVYFCKFLVDEKNYAVKKIIITD